MEWTNKKVIEFLKIMQTEPCLWDPRQKNYKNRASQNDAWRRIIELLPFKTTVKEIKKKKESLLGYYRIHLNKYKKSLKLGAGKDVYSTNWFAFEIMDSFLRVVYESNRTLNTTITEDNDTQEKTKEENNTNANSPQISFETPQRENKISLDVSLKSNGRDRKRDDFPRERTNTAQMDEAFEYDKKKDDECEIFGKLIATKFKKMSNPSTRDILMNDIHDLVFRTCMTDRLEQESTVPAFWKRTNPGPMPNPSTYPSPSSPSTSQSPHHEAVFSSSPNPSTY